VIVAVATVGLTTVMTSSRVIMIVFSVIAFFIGMKHGEFCSSP
jgi:hypothetical protein